VAIEPHVEW